jgi:hypothetical protein
MLAVDTIIPTLRGDRYLSDIAEAGDTPHVFTWDGKRVTVGQIQIGRRVHGVPQRLELDDGSEVRLGQNTRVLMRDEAPVPVSELVVGCSLLPLYLKTDKQGYFQYREPGKWHKNALTTRDKQPWRLVSRMVAEWKLGRRVRPGDKVIFREKDRRNCTPENLLLEHGAPKQQKQTAKFVKPLLKAHRLIQEFGNHKVGDIHVDISGEMFSIKGIGTANLSVGGVFICVDLG